MSLSLNELGRAVFESTPEELRPVKKTWEELDDESHRVANIFALAAVERFAAALDDETDIAALIASLRDEPRHGK